MGLLLCGSCLLNQRAFTYQNKSRRTEDCSNINWEGESGSEKRQAENVSSERRPKMFLNVKKSAFKAKLNCENLFYRLVNDEKNNNKWNTFK